MLKLTDDELVDLNARLPAHELLSEALFLEGLVRIPDTQAQGFISGVMKDARNVHLAKGSSVREADKLMAILAHRSERLEELFGQVREHRRATVQSSGPAHKLRHSSSPSELLTRTNLDLS